MERVAEAKLCFWFAFVVIPELSFLDSGLDLGV